MCQEDYGHLLVEFSKASLATGAHLLSQKHYREFVRLFERSCAISSAGKLEPIGSSAFGLDTLKISRGRFELKGSATKRLLESGNMPFPGREDWREQVASQIRLLKARS